jgi:putative addiction module component (TIGR02574 family)
VTATFQKKAQRLRATLSPQERIALADLLYASVPVESQEEIDRAWNKEIKRRVDEYKAGRAVTHSEKQVHQRMKKVLDEARRARERRHD